MGKVIAVCTSEKKGTQKTNVGTIELKEDWGIENDAHAGKWHRQVSLLSYEKVEEFRARGAKVDDGAFGENLVVSGYDFKTLPIGTKFRCNDVLLELLRCLMDMHAGIPAYPVAASGKQADRRKAVLPASFCLVCCGFHIFPCGLDPFGNLVFAALWISGWYWYRTAAP